MTRTLAAAAALAVLAFAGSASAQTWGQPVYVNSYGRPVGGSPLSEVETRSYVATGAWADGYSDRPYVYAPAPAYGPGHGRHGYAGDPRHGYSRGHGRSGYRYDPPSQAGYRDWWGYDDDRHPSARRGSDDRRSRRYDRDCGCADVYLYDR